MATKQKNLSTEELLTALTQAVCAEYPFDPSAPSVVISYLKTGEWYASIARYTEPFGKGKTVIRSAKAATLNEVIGILAAHWVGVRDAKSRLRAMLDMTTEVVNRLYGSAASPWEKGEK